MKIMNPHTPFARAAFIVAGGLLLSLQMIGCAPATEEPRTETIATPDGPVAAKTQVVPEIVQKITPISPKDEIFIASHAARGSEFVAAYLPAVESPTLKDFDAAFRLWQTEKGRRYSEEQVVQILGASLGKKIVEDFGMQWVVVTDEYGTDFGVKAPRHELLTFPFSSVLKRVESEEYDFMSGIYFIIKDQLENGELMSR